MNIYLLVQGQCNVQNTQHIYSRPYSRAEVATTMMMMMMIMTQIITRHSESADIRLSHISENAPSCRVEMHTVYLLVGWTVTSAIIIIISTDFFQSGLNS